MADAETIDLYLEGAHGALAAADFSLSGDYYGLAVNRAYYAFFYAASALLLTRDVTRAKHSGVMAAFREHFVRSGIFTSQESRSYGEAFELRTITDYEMMGRADKSQAESIVAYAHHFVEHCRDVLSREGFR